jgi:hypothetical protein
MSGLGATINPDGEPGSVTHNVPLQPETTPDNPKQIVQSTAIQTLDQLLHSNWIYDSTFTASTSQPAGTILYVKPIHPLEWNWPNRIVSAMFNLWTGSGKIRFRPLATAWYGGSIRCGFLPPNMSLEEVHNVPLEVLTSYPNRDIDPKNTAWVDFRGPDQREISYHYLKPFDDTDRQNFGGYIVFYVAGKLVTQAPDFTTIQFIVETAGDFLYDQPSPRALTPSGPHLHPLGNSIFSQIQFQPLIDSADAGLGNVIQVCASTVTQLTVGGIGMSGVGKAYALFNTTPGITKLAGGIDDKYKAIAAHFDSMSKGAGDIHDDGTNNMRVGPKSGADFTIPRYNRAYNESGDAIANVGCHNAGGLSSTKFGLYKIAFDKNGIDTDTLESKIVTTYIEPTGPSGTYEFNVNELHWVTNTANNTTSFVNPALAPTGLMTLAPVVGGESIVIFANVRTHYFATQTMNMAYELGKFAQDMTSSDVSYLYNIVNEAGTPLLLVRLNPNGIFTTTPSASTVVYPGNTYLRYFGTLPTSSPLPPLTAQAKLLRHTLARASRSKAFCLQDIKDEVDMF